MKRAGKHMQVLQYENSSIQRQREEAEKEIFTDSVWNGAIKYSMHGNKGMKISWIERDKNFLGSYDLDRVHN